MEAITGVLTLKKGREKPIQKRHPWVFSGSVEQTKGDPRPGDLVAINDSNGQYLATGYYNPHSQIRARLLTWDPNEAIDDRFWQSRIERALDGRAALSFGDRTDSFRVVNAEADGLPGLIVDRYADYLVFQSLTLGIERRKEKLAQILIDQVKPAGIIERSDVDVRQKEGLQGHSGLLWGINPPQKITIQENEHLFAVDLWHGHKTGFYLDQRDNRAIVGHDHWLVGRKMLNVFSYTGGFSVYAAHTGAASITNVDSSIPALEMAEENVKLNVPQRSSDEYVAGDAFEVLRYFREEGMSFDVVVLDPPKFAHNRSDVQRASRGYKDLNWLALHLICSGGLMATFSCSGHISSDLLQKILFAAAVDAHRDVQILSPLSQSADHPVLITFPQSAYLKGFLCRVW